VDALGGVMPLVPSEVPVHDEPGRRDAVAVRPQGTDQLVVDGDVAHGRSVAAKGALTVG
jgi:hypothetical protein